MDDVKAAFKLNITYKLILTDFGMPVLDGIDATKEVRRFYNEHNIPREEHPIILGVTGHVQNQYKVQGIEAGMDDVIAKPIYFDVLKAWITRLNLD